MVYKKSFRMVKFSLNQKGTGPVDDNREDSPEHIYHQIGTNEVIRVSKKKSSSASPKRSSNKSVPEKNSSNQRLEAKLDNVPAQYSKADKIIITKNSASRKPRFPSKGMI